jgi:threonine dehydratase
VTPLEQAPAGLTPGRDLWLKREDVHELGAFKWRGALPALEQFREAGADTVVTASTGNHGAATAWAAAQLRMRAVVYVPERAGETKLALLRAHGAELHSHGADLDEAKDEARRFATAEGAAFFEDGAEAAQYDGYGAIAHELLDQLETPPSAVVVPVGNGALLGGIGRVIHDRCPQTLRVGVVAAQAPVMARSWEEGRPVEEERCATVADGLAVRVAIPYAVFVLAAVASRMLEVSEREIARALVAFADAGVRVEGAAAAGLAALPRLGDVEGPIVLVVTGRNVDDALLEQARTNPELFPL